MPSGGVCDVRTQVLARMSRVSRESQVSGELRRVRAGVRRELLGGVLTRERGLLGGVLDGCW